MFENLKLFQLKGLKGCELSELSQINVICGKNNSGKSTVLEAINSPANRTHGKIISDGMLDKLQKSTIGFFPFRDSYQYVNAYKDCLNSALQNKKVWYADEFIEFKGQLQGAFQKNSFLREYSKKTLFDNLSNEFTQ